MGVRYPETEERFAGMPSFETATERVFVPYSAADLVNVIAPNSDDADPEVEMEEPLTGGARREVYEVRLGYVRSKVEGFRIQSSADVVDFLRKTPRFVGAPPGTLAVIPLSARNRVLGFEQAPLAQSETLAHLLRYAILCNAMGVVYVLRTEDPATAPSSMSPEGGLATLAPLADRWVRGVLRCLDVMTWSPSTARSMLDMGLLVR